MALRRRLALCLLTGGLLLGVYMLSVSLEKPRWLMPLKHLSSGSRDPEEPLGRETSRDQGTHQPPGSSGHPELPSGPSLHEHTPAPTVRTQTPTAPQHKAAENHAPDGTRTSTEGHMVRQHHGTWTSTEGPMVRQHHGTRTSAEGPMGLQHHGTRTSTEGPMVRQHHGTRTSTEGPKTDGPTEPPFIGDSYMREDAPPQTVCPDGVRSRVTNTEFGGRFLDRIPVLQWAESVTREEHQRLSRYPGGHGWGGIDYKTLVDTLSVLNSSANWRLLDDWQQRSNDSECIRCAVVGNGGILKDSRKGQEIDGHHYVFRTNGAITKGFEQDVGSRTTHYTFSTNTMMNSMRSYAGAGYRGPPQSTETRYVFLPDHDRDYLLMKAAATRTLVKRGPERAKDPSRYFGEDVSAEKLKMYHPDFIRYLRNRFLRSKTLKTKYKDIYRPSTGAVMLLAALHTCDQVSAYGFMTPDYRKYSDHYYDSRYHPVGFFINHDLLLEMGLWQQLHQAGLMRLYMHE